MVIGDSDGDDFAERRRALTDEERIEEDRRNGQYCAPGEVRRQRR